MFKNIIIGVLLLLLTITVYYLICLVNSMESFEKERIDIIKHKENYIQHREKGLIEKEACNNELTKCSKIMNEVKLAVNSE